MAKRSIVSGNFKAVLRNMEKGIRLAFLQAVEDLTAQADIRRLEDALSQRDIETVFAIIGLAEDRYYAGFARAIEIAYYEGATREGELINAQTPTAMVIRFDGRNKRAENWVRERSGDRIVEIQEDTRDSVRRILEQGMMEGRNPRSMALDIVGRKQGPKRVGGIIGLTSQEGRFVDNLRRELADPATMANYFTRRARDRRLDATVLKAQAAGKPVAPYDIDKIASAYADNLLLRRGERIARTESIAAMNAGRYEAMLQSVENGIPEDATTRIWDSTPSDRTRDTHLHLNGQEVRYGEPFKSISGALMLFPGDTSLGAPGSETINCRCSFQTRVDRRKLIGQPRGRPQTQRIFA